MIEHSKKCESTLMKYRFLRLLYDDDGRPLGHSGHSRWVKRIRDFLFQIDIYPQSRVLTWTAEWKWFKTSSGLWDEAEAEDDLCSLDHEGSTAEELNELISNAKRNLRNCVFRTKLAINSGVKLATDSGLKLATYSGRKLATLRLSPERVANMAPESVAKMPESF